MDNTDKLLGIMKTRWKLDDPEAQKAMIENCAFYDKIRDIFPKRCAVPDCGYVLSSLRTEEGGGEFVLPGFGNVCGLCFYMHYALQHPGLKDVFYFRKHHEQWLKDNEGNQKGRDRMGL
jgi:hypothetical protein